MQKLITSIIIFIACSTLSIAIAADKSDKKQLDSFTAYNDTDQAVEIKVGNYWPTPYTIAPHDSKTIWVSTDNQDIHISKIN